MKLFLLMVPLLGAILDVGDGITVDVSDLEANLDLNKPSEMFTLNKKGKLAKMIFGMATIHELDANSAVIDVVGHKCNMWEMEAAGGEDTICTIKEAVEGKWEGNRIPTDAEDIPYMMREVECSLEQCNVAGARLSAKMYVAKGSGYLCEPDCTADNALQTPIVKGTAKWEIVVEDWSFCADGTECETKVADKMKIAFRVGRTDKDNKKMGMKKRVLEEFGGDSVKMCGIKAKLEKKCRDTTDEAIKTKCATVKKNISEKKDEWLEKNKGKFGENFGGNFTEKLKGDFDLEEVLTEEEVELGEEEIETLEKRSGPCKKARNKFSGKPDDQDRFGSEEEGEGLTFGFFNAAQIVKVGETEPTVDDGFVGPDIGTAVVSDSLTIDTVEICVTKFKKLIYDPTGEMTEFGGTEDAPEDEEEKDDGSGTISTSYGILTLLALIAPLLQ